MQPSNSPPARAVLVAVRTPGVSELDCTDSLAELERLVDTLGHQTIASLTQARPNLNGPTVVGEGKLAELARLTGGSGHVASKVKRIKTRAELRREKVEEDKEEGETETEMVEVADHPEEEEEEQDEEGEEERAPVEPGERAQLVIFDCELSPSQMQKLESATGAQVLDRNAVIIQIFHRHARTRQAKLQVELAQLAYLAPRLRETGGASERQGGGIGGKGTGESKLELDRRRIRDRMKELRDQLEAVAGEDERRRERRAAERTVALVGYTNAGKSSLMRALTGSAVLVQDKLFATLDTTVRPMHPETHPKMLVSDTVGFIQKLPHDLVASFRSTLEEALHASLLLFVVDASDRAFHHQLAVTKSVLAEVGAAELPALTILNKIDRVDAAGREALAREFPEAIQMCALAPTDVARLREHIVRFFEQGMVDRKLFVPYTAQSVVGTIRAVARVLSEEYTGDGVTLEVRAPAEVLEKLVRKMSDGR